MSRRCRCCGSVPCRRSQGSQRVARKPAVEIASANLSWEQAAYLQLYGDER